MDQLDRKIRRVLREERRRRESRRIVSEAIGIHTAVLREGGNLLEANTHLLEALGQEVRLMEAVAQESEDEEAAHSGGIFRQSLRALLDSFVTAASGAVVGKVLRSLGVAPGSRAYGALSRIIVNVFEELVDEVALGKRRVSDLWSCEVLSGSLASAVTESLPEAIFDTFIGLRPGQAPTGMMLTVREGIVNYFSDAEVVQSVADGFKDVLCSMDLVSFMRDSASGLMPSFLGGTDE